LRLGQILHKYGIQSFAAQPNDPVDLQCQEVLERVEGETGKGGLVSESINRGFKWNKVILLDEEINIYKE